MRTKGIELCRNNVFISHWSEYKYEAQSDKICVESPTISMKEITFLKISLKRLKYYIRKYVLHAKQSSKGGKGQQKGYRTHGKQKVRWQT